MHDIQIDIKYNEWHKQPVQSKTIVNQLDLSYAREDKFPFIYQQHVGMSETRKQYQVVRRIIKYNN